MTSKSATKFSLLIFLIVAVLLVISSEGKHDETKLTFYLQDITVGPNGTAIGSLNGTDVILTGIPGKVWSYLSFGTVFVFDDAVTEGPDKNSPEIDRAQGTSVTTSPDGAYAQISFSIVFTNKEYKGSTLEIQGGVPQLLPVYESAVVGGTGKFRFANGFVTFELVYVDESPPILYSVYRLNVTVRL